MSHPIGPSMPSIGRIVHLEAPPVTVPAIVTAVLGDDGTVGLTAFPPGAPPAPLMDVPHDEAGSPGSWHWPGIVR